MSVKLFKNKQNIDRMIVDSHGNRFRIVECHSGFVWLSNGHGMKQIDVKELKYYNDAEQEGD